MNKTFIKKTTRIKINKTITINIDFELAANTYCNTTIYPKTPFLSSHKSPCCVSFLNLPSPYNADRGLGILCLPFVGYNQRPKWYAPKRPLLKTTQIISTFTSTLEIVTKNAIFSFICLKTYRRRTRTNFIVYNLPIIIGVPCVLK